MATNVVEISDGDSSEEDEAAEVDDEDGNDVQMVLHGVNETGMGQSGWGLFSKEGGGWRSVTWLLISIFVLVFN